MDAHRGDNFTFDSAGVAPDTIGRNADPRAVRSIEARGIDIANHCSRPITAADFDKFDVLLALDHTVQADLISRAPVGRGHIVRSLMSFAPAVGVDEVPDPWYGGAEDYEHALDLIAEAVDGVLDAFP
jgi:protein-tyrosine phosphatase